MLRVSGKVPSSFRDPSGFLFHRKGSIFRQINTSYKKNYDQLMDSGLYQNLVKAGLLIPHKEVKIKGANLRKAYKIIKPELIPFISYPYEWCFSQLKNAALITLEIQKKAFEFGMSLKDCSAYNIQFVKGKPMLIDTLSFEEYHQGSPWIAYRQFCQHFLSPLALMSHKDIRLNQLFRVYIDGIPLDLTSSLLPFYTFFKFSLLSHIHLHAKSEKHFADKVIKKDNYKINRLSLLSLIDNLESTIKNLNWQPRGTEWANYYKETNYSRKATKHKKQIVVNFLKKLKPKTVWDLGANTGSFSRLASKRGVQTISFDIDPVAVEKNYLESVSKKEANVLPLLLDLTNPSPNIGWENQERMSLLDRGPTDTVFSLALIHHLAISNNLQFNKIAHFFSKICKSLIIEFVPKNDSQVKKLLATREDIFPDYTQESFEAKFRKYFIIKSSIKIKNSQRIMYLMKKKHN